MADKKIPITIAREREVKVKGVKLDRGIVDIRGFRIVYLVIDFMRSSRLE